MQPETSFTESFCCPLPVTGHKNILLAHGGGGKLTQQLLEKLIYPSFKNDYLEQRHDGAVIQINGSKIAFTTDSYVVSPIFFPGGDIGKLAVFGTVNDLAMCGAKPRWLSIAVIIEEGLPMEILIKVVESIKNAAKIADVQIVTGDTKVVDKGKGDGLFINTAGIGIIETPLNINPLSIQPGDKIIINGDIGRHGMAIMSVREGLEFESEIISDCANLNHIITNLLENGVEIHCLRDLTRGGLASALNEIASVRKIRLDITESAVPVTDEVKGACEILGLDPFYVANEGRFVAFVPEKDAQKTLEIIQKNQNSTSAAIIGEVKNSDQPLVTRLSSIGTVRILDMLSGEQLPRIC
ncbi:MAG: hydrogenase expression/formation protein HypE [Verrucomicrobiia bacterium]|jgi:hydrogenase expression/formation protein HypE